MVEPKLALLEMQIKALFFQAPETSQGGFGVPPKAFYLVDMTRTAGKFIVAMIDPEMLLVSQVHQAVVSSPSIGMDDTFNVDSAPDHGLKGETAAIRYDLDIDPAFPLENPEDNGCFASTSAAKTFDSPWPEVAFINLNFASDRRFMLANLNDSLTNRHEVAVHGIPVQPRDRSDLGGVQINDKELNQLSELGLRNLLTGCVLITH
jgi:hypothetical protein